MRIKLISPRVTMRPMDSAWKTRMSPPLSLLVLAALTPEEHEVTLADENIECVRTDDAPDLVGITVKVDTVARAAEIARAYRSRNIPVVMGGIHATCCPEDCLPCADAVVIGEAEGLWPTVLADAAKGELRRTYRSETPPDMGASPVPRRELLNDKAYLFTNTLCMGRGCPWRCDFCYNSSANIVSRHRMKPIENIVREIRSIGIRHIMFIDDNFIGNPVQARTLLLKMKEMDLTWHAAVSADIGDHDDLLDLMKESGCKSLFIGFESVNQQNLLQCHKRQNRIETYDATIAKVHDRGIMVNASLVFGFDEDDISVFPETLEWLVGNRIATMTAHILTPYPGTRLYRQFLEQGRILDRDPTRFNTAHVTYKPKKMSASELEHGYRWIYNEFYSWRNIVRRWPNASAQVVAYLEFSLPSRTPGFPVDSLGREGGLEK